MVSELFPALREVIANPGTEPPTAMKTVLDFACDLATSLNGLPKPWPPSVIDCLHLLDGYRVIGYLTTTKEKVAAWIDNAEQNLAARTADIGKRCTIDIDPRAEQPLPAGGVAIDALNAVSDFLTGRVMKDQLAAETARLERGFYGTAISV
jgi:hypothetical protein